LLAYRAVLSETDRQLGRLLAGLRDRDLESRTLVLFAGDNGPEPPFDGVRTGGLRGMKWSLYEGGIRVPLIARWPGKIPAGRVDRTSLIAAIDVFPTVAALCGIAAPTNAKLDGEDLSAAFLGQMKARTNPLFWEYGRKPPPVAAAALGGFPYPKDAGSRSPNVAVREGPWKLLVNADGSGAELFDIADDPQEKRDRAAEQPELTRRLATRALAWRRSLP
jgi:arylsulfatase A-like enzyme